MKQIVFIKNELSRIYDLDEENFDPVVKMNILYECLQHLHQEYISIFRIIADLIKKRKLSYTQYADVGYFFRELESLFDELRKDAKAHKELNSKILSLLLQQEFLQNPDSPESVSGDYASARPTITKRPKVPKRDSKEMEMLCKHFNIPLETLDEGIFKLDWKKTSDYLTELAEQGKELPIPLETWDDFQATYTRKRSSK